MKKILVALMCTLIAILLSSCSYYAPQTPIDYEGELVVHFIDVGQGDSVLLESANEYMLIDAGEAEYGPTVCQYLENNSVETLSYVVATHPHSDHFGGLTEVINNFTCDNFITTETDQQTTTWLNVLNAVSDNNVNYIDAKVGATYTLGNSTFQIMGPHSDNYDDYNNYSVVIKATCGNNSFMFTGDAEKLAENEMLDYTLDLSADVLKVGHHGAKNVLNKEMFESYFRYIHNSSRLNGIVCSCVQSINKIPPQVRSSYTIVVLFTNYLTHSVITTMLRNCVNNPMLDKKNTDYLLDLIDKDPNKHNPLIIIGGDVDQKKSIIYNNNYITFT